MPVAEGGAGSAWTVRPARQRDQVVAGAGVALVVVEALVALLFGPEPVLAACALILAPGLALTPLLPLELRAPAVRVAVVPLVGVAVSSIAVITESTLGIALTGLSVRLLLLLVTAAGLVASIAIGTRPAGRGPAGEMTVGPAEGPTLLLLGAALCLGITLEGLVVGGKPLPGQDWGHYLLYVDQIRHQHSLLIDNPYWMLGGRQFSEDPGAPSVYGAYALLSDVSTPALAQGIWLFAALGILSLFVFVATLWGRTAGLIAAGLYAAVPMNIDILAWHGLANVYALVILPLVLLAAAMALRGRTDYPWGAFLGSGLVALAAAHRLTFLVALIALLPCLAWVLIRRPRQALAYAAMVIGLAALLGAGVVADLIERTGGAGGVQDYRAYLLTKVQWDLVGRDLTTLFAVLGAVALVLLLVARPLRSDPARLVLYGLLLAVVGLSYGWVVHFPTDYTRPTYYLPLVLAAAIGVAWSALVPRLALAAVAVVLLVALQARDLVPVYRAFYGFTNRGSLAGLDYAKTLAKPDDVLVTDNCWGFLSTWLLKQPVLAALDPSQILPKSEVAPASTARRILYGGKAGARIARRVGARFAIVDPQCTHQNGEPVAPPNNGRPIFASTRLVVLDLQARDRALAAP